MFGKINPSLDDVQSEFYDKLENLHNFLKKYDKAVIAFSGGVDSAFLLYTTITVIGKHNVIALTAFSDAYPLDELEFAKKIALKFNVKHVVIETDEMNDSDFTNNTPDRCYFCKKDFFSKIIDYAKENNISSIFDGTNKDDEKDYRPGRKALVELGIISPLLETGFTKADIRELSRQAGLETWNKAANPCLASRIPYGNNITIEKLKTVEKAEKFLRDNGLITSRVRHHDKIARIEVAESDINRITTGELRKKIIQYFKSLGFTWITVDIEGYRTGSLNEEL